MLEPKIIVDFPHHNAECPLWHPQQQYLYWTDIPRGKLYRYNPQTQTHSEIYSGESVGGLTLQADGSLVLFKTKGTVQIWDEGKITTLIDEIPAEKHTRFNDAIADPAGRVFSGTMATSEDKGRLYRIDTDGSIHVILEELLVPNGMGFSPDLKYFYLTDSDTYTIYRFDYNQETGNITNQQNHIIIPQGQGVPDGMTVDAEGYIWSARWDGSSLYRYTPQGMEVLRIQFPALKVSCLAFGGSDYSEIYATTAGGNNRSQEGAGAGAIFHLQSKVKGVPEFTSRIVIS
ncbi:MAG: SMP-30/gluconolactonase/LRE family protein [Rivularia sp. (in: Bacteria)]|nr:SMP-30/gluconolactonase/LRE family protein [Rivularia sp. MS3]